MRRLFRCTMTHAARCIVHTLAFCAALALPTRAHAFSYAEHCRVSNAAFLAAATPYVSSRSVPGGTSTGTRDSAQIVAAARARRIAEVWAELTGARRCAGLRRYSRSYGDIVARVDVASSPNDFYVGKSNPLAFGQVSSDSIPWQTIDRLSESTMQRLSAMHANQDHFGDRALFGFTFWHRAALEAAANGRLSTALLINAFADHYLEDLFAPGHVRTARRGLPDAASMGLHNQFNRAGARYSISNIDSLMPYARVASAELMHDTRCEDRRQAACLAALRAECASSNWEVCLKSVSDSGLTLYGDHQLHESPTAELFIALVIARSVDDVLRAFLDANPNTDHFAGRVFWSRARNLGVRRAGATFSTPYGRYEPDTVGVWSDVDRAPTVVFGLQSFVTSPSRRVRVAVETMALPWLGENLTIPADSLAWVNPKGLSRFGLTGGIDAVFGDSNFGIGPYVDVVWSLTDINSQLRLGTGWRYWSQREFRNANAFHGALRWELGFGLLSTGIGLELEPIIGRNGAAISALSIGTSLHATVPIRRHKRK